MTVPILAITAVVGLDTGPMAMFGSLIALWNTGRPLLSRLRTFGVVGLVLTASLALGVVVAPVEWLFVPTIVVVTLVSVLAYYAFVIAPGPGPLNLFFSCAMGTYLGSHTDKGWEIVLVTAASAACTALLSLSDLVRRPHHPEQSAVHAARVAVERYDSLAEGAGPMAVLDENVQGARDAATFEVHRAWALLRTAHGPAATQPAHTRLEQQLLDTEGMLACRLITDHLPRLERADAEPERTGSPGRPPSGQLLRRALGQHSPARLIACRNALAAGLAALTAQLASIGHPYWAVLSSTIVLHSGVARGPATHRALHRTVGTCLGVAVVVGIEAQHPARPAEFALMLLGVLGMNLLLPRHYSLAVICVTLMAMMANAASDPTLRVPQLLTDRLLETAVGVCSALFVLWMTGRRSAHHALLHQLKHTADAVDALLDLVDANPTVSAEDQLARRDLQFELGRLQATLTHSISDDPRLSEWRPVERAVVRTAHEALAASWHTGPPPATPKVGDTRTALRMLRRELASPVRTGR
ncbi:FUSC family protein [Streptomyces sp. NPDC005356]|uniref:FUSC family protein n=1 Tax=Streptomyces sp. NPDC005356 TaxID=3157167 RepID=UPI0033A0FE6E